MPDNARLAELMRAMMAQQRLITPEALAAAARRQHESWRMPPGWPTGEMPRMTNELESPSVSFTSSPPLEARIPWGLTGMPVGADAWTPDWRDALRYAITTYIAQGGLSTRDATRETERGVYLCEVCFDAQTDHLVPAEASPTGVAMARCQTCEQEGKW